MNDLGRDAIVELMDTVDANIPEPDRTIEAPFMLPVESVHSISGR